MPLVLLFCMIFGVFFRPLVRSWDYLFLLRPVRFGFRRLRLRLVFFLVSCLPPSVPLCVVLFVAATLTHKAGPDRRRNPAGCSRPPLAQVARGSPSGQAGTATGHVKFRLTDTSVGHVPQGHFHAHVCAPKAGLSGTPPCVLPRKTHEFRARG